MLSSIRELDEAPRRFLLFVIFNVVSWQCIVGPAMILFARHIDMPPAWVGFLISFMPLSTLLVVVTLPLVLRLGPKRLMAATWGLRNLTACGVFLVPWVMSAFGMRAGWIVLLATTLGFCLVRAVGVGGWFPWLHEVVPEDQRGTYFSAETTVTQLINVGVVLTQGLMLSAHPATSDFLAIYGVGVLAGLASLLWMYRVPGGHRHDEQVTLKASLASYRVVLSDRRFLQFILITSLGYSALNWLGAGVVMYMRDMLGISSRAIMIIMAAASFGILLTIRPWGRYADHSGSGHAMALGLGGHAIAAAAALFVLPGSAWMTPLLVCVVVSAAMLSAAFSLAAHRAMLNYVQEEGKVGYTNVWTVGTALALGLTPIAVGRFVEWWGFAGFRASFVIAALGALGCAMASWHVVQEAPGARRSLTQLVNPSLPVRMVARIAWISAGMHESNRRPGGR